jgi:hypothetical protein
MKIYDKHKVANISSNVLNFRNGPNGLLRGHGGKMIQEKLELENLMLDSLKGVVNWLVSIPEYRNTRACLRRCRMIGNLHQNLFKNPENFLHIGF